MGFYIRTDVDDYRVRPWLVRNSDVRSIAVGKGYFDVDGCFLRVRESAEGAAQKIGQNYTPQDVNAARTAYKKLEPVINQDLLKPIGDLLEKL